MFFVDGYLRKLCLKGKSKETEKIIADLALELCKLLGIKECILVYDRTKNCYNVNTDSLKFTVCSASPNFKTSDDALVEWMVGLSAPENVLVVTSDKGLQIRLVEKGIKKLMKTGPFFKLLKEKLGEGYEKILKKDNLLTSKEEEEKFEIIK